MDFKEKMKKEGIPEIAIKNFEYYYNMLRDKSREGTVIPEKDIEEVKELPDAENLSEEMGKKGQEALKNTVMIKLNGGLGTSMGLDKPKSMLKVKEGLSFLDITIKQAVNDQVPLVLMDSFRTREESLEVMKSYPELRQDIDYDFLQNKVPKLLKSDLSPAKSEDKPELEWCPPGHGDIYLALKTSGMLDRMLDMGYRYAFVSNADNLGAIMDNYILGYFASKGISFMMEVADRTEADKKGGHIAMRDNQMILREVAQCPEEDLEEFRNINKHKFFNTNSLWINLEKLKEKMDGTGGIMKLPLICNSKNLDPRDPESPEVYQLETAMGSAISVFEDSEAIRIPRRRFLPVKKTNDLLAIRSDRYLLDKDYRVIRNPECETESIFIDLDKNYYKLVEQMESRFEEIPSMLSCSRFEVEGDVKFGSKISLKGEVRVKNEGEQKKLENTTLEGVKEL